MCGTVTLGLLGGLIASKLLFRSRFRHLRHGGFGRFRRFGQAPPPPPVVAATPARLDSLIRPLELSQRQAEEAREAFADVAQALGPSWAGWRGLEEALAAVAAEPFDKARAQAALGTLEAEPSRLAVDALEHFHNILTPEQRDHLDAGLLRKSPWR